MVFYLDISFKNRFLKVFKTKNLFYATRQTYL